MLDIKDLSFRTDHNNNMIVARKGEYVCNIVKMLFNMIPGSDEYNPDRGLNIRSQASKPNESGYRDSSYESEIVRQFNAYTDLIPMNVIARFKDHKMHIYMKVRYRYNIYEVDVTNEEDELVAALRR